MFGFKARLIWSSLHKIFISWLRLFESFLQDHPTVYILYNTILLVSAPILSFLDPCLVSKVVFALNFYFPVAAFEYFLPNNIQFFQEYFLKPLCWSLLNLKTVGVCRFSKEYLQCFMLNILDITLSLTIVYLFYLFQLHTFIIPFIQSIYPSPFAKASLHFFIACCSEGKNLPGVPSRDSNSDLPYTRLAHYQLSYAAP
jgi:hypothetical protein